MSMESAYLSPVILILLIVIIMNNRLNITIVLATYNGEKYLREQLNSITRNKNFNLLVKEIIITDDSSTDDTKNIIEEFQREFKNIRLINNPSKGVISNFINGVKNATSKFIMFSDQDDVWLPDKINLMYETITKMIEKHGDNVPLLAFSDLKVVDKELNTINNSFLSYTGFNLNSALTLPKLIVNNVAPGCVMIINRELVNRADISNTSNWFMHDWWFILIAKIYGHVELVRQPLMLYRQHENNVLGASSKKTAWDKILKLNNIIVDYKISLEKRLKQKNYLLERLKEKVDAKKAMPEEINAYNQIKSNSVMWLIKNEATRRRRILALLSFFIVNKE